MASAVAPHVYLDDQGRAWIDDTNTKVVEIVLEKLAHNASPEAIQEQHPHLSLAQIHAALTYYYDHQDELDAQIARDEREVEQLRAQAKDQPMRAELVEKARAKGIRL